MRLRLAYIRALTLLYISSPLIPFFIGWMRIEYGILLTLLLCFGAYKYIKSLDLNERIRIEKRDLLIGGTIVIIWLFFSGAGGMGYQFSDHIKNNTLAKELSNLSWPLSYNVEGETMYLSHYLSFYIVGPTVAGWMGYTYAQLVVFLWTSLGTFLGLFWLARACGKVRWQFFLFFILFGGISLFSFIFKYGTGFGEELLSRLNNHGYVFWMNSWDIIPLNYLHITDMLYWTPQHFIPALIGIGIILNDGFVDKNIKYTPFLLSLLVMWSPLILVGIFPYFLFVLFKHRFYGVFNIVNLIVAPIIFIVCGFYLLAIESQDLVKHFIFASDDIQLSTKLGVYFYFILFEVLVWLVPIYLVRKGMIRDKEASLFFLLSIILILIPLYRFGLWNDWCNRVSMPSLVLLGYFAFKAFIDAKKWKRTILTLLIVLASIGPLMDILGSIKYSNYHPKFRPPYEQNVESLPEICVSYPITQFVASEDAFFFKYLAKRPKNEPALE